LALTTARQPPSPDPQPLWDAALDVLRANDLGGWTRPGSRLYPHQWSWDSAFVAMGLAYVDPGRALAELETLFAAQWSDGRVPHIVYDPAAPPEAYFPDAARWTSPDLAAVVPTAPATSGICDPPIHAFAAWRVWEIAEQGGHAGPPLRERLRALYPRLLAWHRYLATARDPDAAGLITIYHPWESGTDNSPRWDAALAKVVVGPVPPYTRRDLGQVSDPSQRPTDAEYDRYLWLVESLKAAGYEDAAVHRRHPFLVKDVLASAIFALANRALYRLAERLGAPAGEREELATWADRFGRAVEGRWDPAEGLAFDLDLRTGRPIVVRTLAGLAPLLVPDLRADLVVALARQLAGPSFAAVPGLAYPAVPSTTPGSPGFHPRTYWRGPLWPFANWLLWWGLRQHGHRDLAAALRRANLELLARPGARFAEYFEPFSGEPLGSPDQSWTAAVALDWLATAE
jgi:hypothetical protein